MENIDDTLGSIVDKITIVNIKIFFALNDHMDLESHLNSKEIRMYGDDQAKEKIQAEIGKVSMKVQGLNRHRNDLIDMMDEFLELAINGGVQIRRPKFKKYGTVQEIMAELKGEDDIPF